MKQAPITRAGDDLDEDDEDAEVRSRRNGLWWWCCAVSCGAGVDSDLDFAF